MKRIFYGPEVRALICGCIIQLVFEPGLLVICFRDTEKMNKIATIIIVLLFAFVGIPKSVYAEVQSEDLCYSQCAAYKFVWQGDYCWDTFQSQCSSGSGKSLQDTIKFLKSIYGVIKSGDNVDTVFKAWFVCKPLIENCIVPQLTQCRQTCQVDQYFYAPDLSVGHPDSRYHGVVYSEKTRQLYFKLVNNGRGYAWDIDVEASYGHTANRDGKIQGGQQLFKEKVEHLIYLGARNGPPKTASDYVVDFLIEESNFSSWLQGFKSDADDYNVPNYWVKTIPFTPVAGELNRVIFNVDGSKLIPESNENNNTFIFDLDLRPTPARFMIENVSQQLVDQALNSFTVSFKVKNTGEEAGNASAKIYEGEYQTGKTPIHDSVQTVNGQSATDFETTINIDLSGESNPYCGKRKTYTIVVTDQEGNQSMRTFTLPIYVGTVHGRVEDLFGKSIEGATVKTASGVETTANKYGNFHLKGITSLGNVVITASKREFSKPDSKTLNFKFVNEFEACKEGNLTFGGVNFVLKNQDVLFTVTVKDTAGNPVTAHVIAANELWRTEADISGSGPLHELQPGQYVFTVSAPGYKTISQDVNAVPNNLNLEFVLEKLNGRTTDASLTITEPQLLWEMDRGSEILGDVRATKDGKTVILYTSQNQSNTGKLYFINSLTGVHNAVVSTISNSGNSSASIDTSYDGNTTALCSNDGKTSGKDRGRNWLQLYSSAGVSLGQLEYDNSNSTKLCEVSPDGFFIYPYGLINKGFHVYTDWEILGHEKDNSRVSYGSYKGIIFTPQNTILAGCPEGGGLCTQTINRTVVNSLGQVKGTPVFSDSSQDGAKITTITTDKVYLFSSGGKQWEKDVDTRGDSLATAVSPGGEYVMYTTNTPTSHRTIKIANQSGVDQTPSGVPDNTNQDVVYVSANDKGLFYMVAEGKKLKYYQVGHYTTDYVPETTTQTNAEEWTTGISSMGWAQKFQSLGSIRFADLDAGTIYRADRTIRLAIILPFTQTSLGVLTITKDTLFSVNNYHNPVLLKGQMTANLGSPINIYAIKFNEYSLGKFEVKLTDFIHNLLPEDEYFIVKNIHTKYTVKNNPNEIEVGVEDGEVQVFIGKTEKTVTSGRKIKIDATNQAKESVYVNTEVKAIIIGAFILLTMISLYLIYRFRKINNRKRKVV